jgi:hypothetical protein
MNLSRCLTRGLSRGLAMLAIAASAVVMLAAPAPALAQAERVLADSNTERVTIRPMAAGESLRVAEVLAGYYKGRADAPTGSSIEFWNAKAKNAEGFGGKVLVLVVAGKSGGQLVGPGAVVGAIVAIPSQAPNTARRLELIGAASMYDAAATLPALLQSGRDLATSAGLRLMQLGWLLV